MKQATFLSLLALCLLATPSHAATTYVHAGNDLQTAINNAQPGDVLVLDAGATFTGPGPGPITLPDKGDGNSSYITIESSALGSLPDALNRVSPGDGSYMPKIVSPGSGQPALQTEAHASHYMLIGIEFRTASASDFAYDLIELGSAGQTSLSDVPHDLILDHCLVTAFPTQSLKRGIELDSSDTTISNCYIAGFKSTDQDAQAIAGIYGPGPFHIINNYLEASGENLMFGGGPPEITGLVPSDIEIRGNYLKKPLSWRPGEAGYDNMHWSVKNLFELKSARRVRFEGNVLENCWRDSRNPGYGAINLVTTTGDSGPQATIEDVTIRNNVMKHTQNVFNILGNDAQNQSGLGLTVENNLFMDVDWVRWSNNPDDFAPYRGQFIKISKMSHVVVNHNTVLQSGNIISAYDGANAGFVFTNNIVNYNGGISGDASTLNSQTIQAYFPDVTLSRNVMIGGNSSFADNYYPGSPTEVYFDYANQNYQLAPNSSSNSLATDGTAIGAHIVQFSASSYSVSEGGTDAMLTVTRSSDSSSSATVRYETSDPAGLTNCNVAGTGVASSRCDYSTTIGTLQFAPGETSKTIYIPIVDDAYAEGNESFTVTLSTPTGALLGPTSSATVTIIDNDASDGANPIDAPPFFVRQQYIDFLDRDPDPGGYQGWQDILNNCPPSGIGANGYYCDRIEVSADFFRSSEFQDRGYFIYRVYATVGRHPFYKEFMPDLARVSGFLTDQQLEANKADFVNEFMTRVDFLAMYGGQTTPTGYVNKLLDTVGLPNHPTKQTWIDSLTNGSKTRAQVLLELVESAEMSQKNYTEAFVVMEYFGYLRRDPDAAYLTWIDIMNQNPSNYRDMINGFMNSPEYRQRFGN